MKLVWLCKLTHEWIKKKHKLEWLKKNFKQGIGIIGKSLETRRDCWGAPNPYFDSVIHKIIHIGDSGIRKVIHKHEGSATRAKAWRTLIEIPPEIWNPEQTQMFTGKLCNFRLLRSRNPTEILRFRNLGGQFALLLTPHISILIESKYLGFTLPPQQSLLVSKLFSAIPIPCLKILFFTILVV